MLKKLKQSLHSLPVCELKKLYKQVKFRHAEHDLYNCQGRTFTSFLHKHSFGIVFDVHICLISFWLTTNKYSFENWSTYFDTKKKRIKPNARETSLWSLMQIQCLWANFLACMRGLPPIASELLLDLNKSYYLLILESLRWVVAGKLKRLLITL